MFVQSAPDCVFDGLFGSNGRWGSVNGDGSGADGTHWAVGDQVREKRWTSRRRLHEMRSSTVRKVRTTFPPSLRVLMASRAR